MGNDEGTISFEQEEIIFKINDPSDCLYIIKGGKVGIFKYDSDGTRIPLGILGEREVLGESSLILRKAHSTEAMALTKVTATKISNDRFEDLLGSCPTQISLVLIDILHRLNKVNGILGKHNIFDPELRDKMKNIMGKPL